MSTKNFNDLAVFAIVAREQSFTRAAAHLGMTPSAVSQAVSGLEARLGLRLLARTTRSVAPTPAGQRLLQTVAPRFQEIEDELVRLHDLQDRVSGAIRINSSEHVAVTVIWPKLQPLLQAHPDIQIEITSDASLVDIVAERYDAGVRLGEQVAKDMIAMRLAPDMRMVVVGAPAYFTNRPVPQLPSDLMAHDCINIRMPTSKALSVWEFEQDGRQVNVRTQGRLIFNSGILRMDAVLSGLGLSYLPDELVQHHIDAGRLVPVLSDWCPVLAGYHLYYPSRRQHSPLFSVVLDALRYST